MAQLNELGQLVDDCDVYLEMLTDDESALSELESTVSTLERVLDQMEIHTLLSGKYDTSDAIFSIQAGAGGTDAQDWVQILIRLYTRWCEDKSYNVSIIDQHDGEEAGIKSVTIKVSGDYAYGYLKHEKGVHRLVRLSPFNANNKRQTSFAMVDVVPHIEDLSDQVTIDEGDLRIDTFRASGAGGQHVNKTDSAVRITHIPTGIVVSSQSSRSQQSNKQVAMDILSSRLVQLMEEQHKDHVNDIRGEKKDIAWGNQIRSYVFHPYKLVKDLRSGEQTSQLQDVLDGDIDSFIFSVMRMGRQNS